MDIKTQNSEYCFRVSFGYERSLMNILAMNDVTNKYRVTMDSMIGNSINVHLGDGNILKLKEVE